MNNQIRKQLEQVKATELVYDDTTLELFIPKTIKILTKAVKVGEVYIIELHNSVTNPTAGSVLAANWNQGIVPKYAKYIVEVIDNMAKMVRVNGVALEDNTSHFMGWLPHDSFDIITKI